MKYGLKPKSHPSGAAFTIVELVVVIFVIAILVTISIVGFSEWRSRAATTEVKSDAAGVQAGMEDARNRLNGYPLLPVGTEFDGSNNGTKTIFVQNKNVRIIYSGGDVASFCVDIQSRAIPSIRMFLNTAGNNQTPRFGTCDTGESAVPLDVSKTIFVFNTAAPGCTGTVQLPVSQPVSGGTIDWGDGTSGARTTSLQSHTYSTPKTYVATFDGLINQASYYPSVNATNAKCLAKVLQWGSGVSPTRISFYNASNMVYTADPPATLTDASYMFYGAGTFNQPIGGWDVSNITNMQWMFDRAASFNQPLANWNTSKVTDMSWMFADAVSFNQPLDTWNTSNVTDMNNMFLDASVFNQPIGSWNTAKVTDMSSMFLSAYLFNQPLGTWNTANVTNMSSMFSDAEAFNQPLVGWNTSKVSNMQGMFDSAPIFNQNISSWNVTAVTSKANFHRLSPLSQANCPPSLW